MDDNLKAAFIEWFNLERQNEAAYRALAANAEFINWPGLSLWMNHAAGDEAGHAGAVAGYLIDRNVLPEFTALEAVSTPQSPDHIDYFRAAMGREVVTTSFIHDLYLKCYEAKDFDAARFMLPYLEEQTHSEREITDQIMMLERDIDRLVFDKGLIK